jgi:hypothetical protein
MLPSLCLGPFNKNQVVGSTTRSKGDASTAKSEKTAAAGVTKVASKKTLSLTAANSASSARKEANSVAKLRRTWWEKKLQEEQLKKQI